MLLALMIKSIIQTKKLVFAKTKLSNTKSMENVHFAQKEKIKLMGNVLHVRMVKYLILKKEFVGATRMKTFSGIQSNVLNVLIQNIGIILILNVRIVQLNNFTT